MKYRARAENQITIYKNAIIHKNNTTLYFVVNLYNYSIYTADSISANIDTLQNMLLNIENIFGTMSFSLFRFEDILSPNAYIDNFIKTVRLWDDSFNPSEEFIKNIKYTTQYYCLLAINIDDKNSFDFNDLSIREIANNYKNMIVDHFANFKQQNIDTKKIESLSTRIANIGQGVIKPCPEEVLLNYYIKRVYPSYNLIIPEEDIDSTRAVLSYLQQDLVPHFNYFEMNNAGVELFGAESHTTYGTVIDIVEFPEEIISESFSLNHDWLVVNCKTLSKQQAKLKFARKKSDIEFEESSAANAGSADASIELQDYKDIADTALAAISAGYKIIEADIHILVTANSIDELNKRRYGLISQLKNQNIIATFAPDQASEYVDSFIRLRPRQYPYLMDIRYPLSFRLTQGAAAGDFDSKFTSPVFGETVSRDEATE